MNKTNYLKIFAFASAAFFLNTTVNAQSSSSRMDREKAQSQIQQKEINSKRADEAKMWVYTVAQVATRGNNMEVKFEKSNEKPQTRSGEMALKQAAMNEDALRKATDSFGSEADVLNFLADQGMELVSVVPNAKDDSMKTYYLRSRLPE